MLARCLGQMKGLHPQPTELERRWGEAKRQGRYRREAVDRLAGELEPKDSQPEPVGNGSDALIDAASRPRTGSLSWMGSNA